MFSARPTRYITTVFASAVVACNTPTPPTGPDASVESLQSELATPPENPLTTSTDGDIPLPPPPSCEFDGRALFVVGDPDLNPSDARVRQRLEDFGFDVETVDDDDVSAQDAADAALVVISKTVLSSTLGTAFTPLPVPVLTFEIALYDDLGLVAPGAGGFGGESDRTAAFVAADAAPPGGPVGTVEIFDEPRRLNWARPVSSARVLATLTETDPRAVAFAVDSGGALANGRTAAARRVGLGLNDDAAERLTPAGWRLFDTAVEWLAGDGVPRPVAVLAVGSGELAPQDNAVRERLQSLGYRVYAVPHDQVDAAYVDAAAVIVISASVSSGRIGTRFTDVAVGLVNGEHALLDELGMASESGLEANARRIQMLAPADPLGAGFAGQVEVYRDDSSLVWGEPSPEATRIAATPGGRPTVFRYETGTLMTDSKAPARRVGFFWYRQGEFTRDGWRLFDAAVTWAGADATSLSTCSASCVPSAAIDATCDGIDDDCDDVVDEDYVEARITCGVGICIAAGTTFCLSGVEFSNCVPGQPDQFDLCDGRDSDCDGVVDEEHVALPTVCGVGICAADGERACVSGVPTDTCTPGTPTGTDTSCDGLDDDCDGATDEAFVQQPTTCGLGVCAEQGATSCSGGVETDTCEPAPPPGDDANCDGLDDDCDGAIDEGFAGTPTTCGLGQCAAQGSTSCVGGTVVDQCTPGAPADQDATCDGLDDDCDGDADEDYPVVRTTCGSGTCTEQGALRCIAGEEVDTCEPGTPTADDTTCNGLDDDCDGATDEGFVAATTTCGVGACADTGATTCENGQVGDTCTAGTPAASDTTCDGIDDDCDGLPDEDFPSEATTCGVGACAATGATECTGGGINDTCTPGTPAVSDSSCDGIDDDCDGRIDEDFPSVATTCGVGACADTGVTQCVDGQISDTCVAGTPALSDATCDGIDDDCDGVADDDFPSMATSCGVGACADTGVTQCVDGQVSDTCVAGTPALSDATCDGIDDDCDGIADDDFPSVATTCGIGACADTGLTTCVNGEVADTCVAGTPADDDATCDGIDDNCNGETDEDYASETTECGIGACADTGATVCADGEVVDSCVEGQPATADATCDGIDDDCDGVPDEDFFERPSRCGVGTCTATGRITCEAGVETDSCQPNAPADDDATCDGLDSDCDGTADEDYVSVNTQCGVGACADTGVTQCVGGTVNDTCEPGQPALEDATCDGIDDDCDGTPDEDFPAMPTSCGVGACTDDGVTTCENGQVGDTCTAGDPAVSDATCDGVDDDCDGTPDEDFPSETTTCGVGACAATGVTQCTGGGVTDTCEPGAPALSDASCDGIDDDCDGRVDEDFPSVATSCGIGACADTGLTTCVNGEVADTCVAGTPADDDATCDGIDDNCNGETDEDYASETTECGIGACADTGATFCADGEIVDSCVEGQPATADATCDGIDDDCDGTPDEDFFERPSRCGVGTCTATGRITCEAGVETNSCQPNAPAADDATCDGLDNDCDGTADEDYVSVNTQCGIGACADTGITQCVGGTVNDTCEPGQPALEDATCDGIDDDCDGTPDEDFPAMPTSCGVGACTADGVTTCENGQVGDTCTAGDPAVNDATCDGVDDDCDGTPDEDFPSETTTCGVGACAATGVTQCTGGGVTDTCEPGQPALSDASCDGIDDDCDGRVDEDFPSVATSCGIGACAETGLTTCVNGEVADTCVAGTPADDDATCDGIDDNCNGETDEDYASETTECGIGACADTGATVCADGEVVDSCVEGQPATADATCDGIDDDCDGVPDEDFFERPSRCGVGTCTATGRITCEAGVEADSCQPNAPADDDATCDGLDNDCDGTADEDYVSVNTSCGVGACADTGVTQCVGGTVTDTCEAGTPAASDVTCNGIDDDCDGTPDEDFPAMPTSCGIGACADTGLTQCIDGQVSDTCVAGTPADDDATCDGIDDNCNGETDEDYASETTECGIGACADTGATFCTDGEIVDSCVEGQPATADTTCDTIDDDCDGSTDEDFFERPSRCGVGTCTATGRITCEAGVETDSCQPNAPAANDATCDGLDSDCDGTTDEDYASVTTSCGVGACADTGVTQCVGGTVNDTCEAGTPTGDDTDCNGIDDDCDGVADDAFPEGPTTCGVGTCAATGRLTCDDGVVFDSCTPRAPAASDATCDGLDDNCNGTADEDYTPVPVECGVGACRRSGALVCVDGGIDNTCSPGQPAAVDDSCDNIDDDCDGLIDEDFAPETTTCGIGGCFATGTTSCTGGQVFDSCEPGVPALDDATCDTLDDDCDGTVDEGYVPEPTTCGIGACGADGATVCVLGTVVDECIPGTPAASDASCDGIDDDCNGEADEDYVAVEVSCGTGVCRATAETFCANGQVENDCLPGTPEGFELCDGRDNDCDGATDEAVGVSRWSRIDEPGPSPRWGGAFAFDEARGQLVLFGGSALGRGSVAETWSWDGASWARLATNEVPERIDHAMAYDPVRERIVLFGGIVDNDPAGDTWEWDGSTWTEVSVDGPGPRYAHDMTYDPAAGGVVLFGGTDDATEFGDTWLWDGTGWTLLATDGPSPRKGHAMTFDDTAGVVQLFGGFDGLARSDTWEWDGAGWTLVAVDGPAPREEHTLAYDRSGRAVVAFGGIGFFSTLFNDLWTWIADWAPVPTEGGPSPRFLHMMGYHPANQGVLVFGGVDDAFAINGETWLFSPVCFGNPPPIVVELDAP